MPEDPSPELERPDLERPELERAAPGGAAQAPPELEPMLAGATGMPDEPAGWLFEPKWDGVRAIARVWDGKVRLTSRLGNDITAGYPELAKMGAALADHEVVLDGEIVAFDRDGHPSFERLQSRMHVRNPGRSLAAEVPVLYVIFDLPWLDGKLLITEPFAQRRRRLVALGPKGPSWQVSHMLPEPPGDELLAASRRMGLEGYVGKLAGSPYTPGKRSRSWTKIKCVNQRELVVGGWSEGSGGRSGSIGSLAVGWVDPDAIAASSHPFALRYAGQVGSGLSEALIRRLAAVFAETSSDVSPFAGRPAPPPGLHSLRPTVVVEVAFNEMTTSGVLRQPSIKGIRNDVDPSTVGWSEELA